MTKFAYFLIRKLLNEKCMKMYERFSIYGKNKLQTRTSVAGQDAMHSDWREFEQESFQCSFSLDHFHVIRSGEALSPDESKE